MKKKEQRKKTKKEQRKTTKKEEEEENNKKEQIQQTKRSFENHGFSPHWDKGRGQEDQAQQDGAQPATRWGDGSRVHGSTCS